MRSQIGAGAIVRQLGAAAGDLLLGSRCAGCSMPGWALCRSCRAEVGDWLPHHTRPEPCPPGFPPTVTAAPYAGLAAALITAHKDRGTLSLATVLGLALATSVARLVLDVGAGERLVLVPAPSAARAIRERGLDAGRAIAQAAARRLRRASGFPVVVRPWLRQRAGVRDQSDLDAAERAENLAGALRSTRRARCRAGDVVIIVDDVVTTGATVTEAVRALGAGGVEVSGAATVAATTRRRPTGSRTVPGLSND